ncbi:hypothetical protein BGX38DRAFT_1281847 [Terfezia claveryi]|nr:hypothetical protein BGX38DRAFT_1281847 [Terfezia claveryi]
MSRGECGYSEEKILMTLQGKHWVKIIRNLSGIADEFLVLEIEKHLHEVFEDNVCAMADYLQSDAEGILLGTEVQAYNAVEIPVLDQDVDDKNSYQLQHVHTVGGKSWRRKEARKDTISVCVESMRLRLPSVTETMKGFNGRVYKLAHVMLLD